MGEAAPSVRPLRVKRAPPTVSSAPEVRSPLPAVAHNESAAERDTANDQRPERHAGEDERAAADHEGIGREGQRRSISRRWRHRRRSRCWRERRSRRQRRRRRRRYWWWPERRRVRRWRWRPHWAEEGCPSSAHWLAKPVAKLLVRPDEIALLNLETANNGNGSIQVLLWVLSQRGPRRQGTSLLEVVYSNPDCSPQVSISLGRARAAQAPPRRSQVFTQTRNQDGGAVLLCKRAQLVCTA